LYLQLNGSNIRILFIISGYPTSSIFLLPVSFSFFCVFGTFCKTFLISVSKFILSKIQLTLQIREVRSTFDLGVLLCFFFRLAKWGVRFGLFDFLFQSYGNYGHFAKNICKLEFGSLSNHNLNNLKFLIIKFFIVVLRILWYYYRKFYAI
jgi:hypothetical protein